MIGRLSPPDDMDSWLEASEGSDWNPGDGFELARAKANDNLTEALVQLGWSADGAGEYWPGACVKPDDVRRRLAAPVELGGCPVARCWWSRGRGI